MSKVIQVHVDEKLAFLVEVQEDDDIQLDSAESQRPELPPGAKPTGILTGVMETMSKTVLAVVQYVREGFVGANHPDELALEFSITLKGMLACEYSNAIFFGITNTLTFFEIRS